MNVLGVLTSAFSTRLLVLSLAAVSISEASDAAEKTCLKIAHIGSQDAPVGSVRMCLGTKERGTADSVLENNWTFDFDAAAFNELKTFVISRRSQPPPEAGLLRIGTFAATWQSDGRQEKYVIPAQSSCGYLDQLKGSLRGADHAEFVRVIDGLKYRARCRRDAGK